MNAWAQTQPDLSACVGITEGLARLACYDRLAGLQGMMKLPASPAEKPATPEATAATAPSDSFMTRYWELSSADKRGTFNYTAYRPNYFLPLRVMPTCGLPTHSSPCGNCGTRVSPPLFATATFSQS